MRLLIKLPSRSRPDKLLTITSRYVEYAEDMSKIQFLITLDADDSSVTEELKEKLTKIHPNISLNIGYSSGKISAINRSMPDPSTFDIVLLASDDMNPVERGYDQIIREKMQRHYPDTDGVLFFNDGHQKQNLNTILICGSKYYRRFGYLYFPEYKSFFCDNEFMVVSQLLNKQTYFDRVIIKHEHPNINSSVELDELYIRNQVYYENDEKIYMSRMKTLLPKKTKTLKIPKVSIKLRM
jgi:hypothetical protein